MSADVLYTSFPFASATSPVPPRRVYRCTCIENRHEREEQTHDCALAIEAQHRYVADGHQGPGESTQSEGDRSPGQE